MTRGQLSNASFQLFFANGVVWSEGKSEAKASVDDWAIKVSVFYSSIAFLNTLTMGTPFPRVPPRNTPSPSVCLSVTRMDCDKSKWCTTDILIPHERAITLLLWHQQWLVGDAHFPLKYALKGPTALRKCRLRQISAYNVSTVRDNEKKFNYDEYKVDHGLSNEL